MTFAGTCVVVQARMGSRRMPGKIFAPLAGEPALLRMMQRVAAVRGAAIRVVATSTEAADDAVIELCERHGIDCARGPLDDVLARVLEAAPAACDTVVRLTADCPLVDPALVDRHIERFVAEEAVYVTNAVERTMPDGLDVEVISRAMLERAAALATERFDREHVTPWIRRHARTVHVTQPVDLSALRWTVDESRDHEVIATIYDELHHDDAIFDSEDVYRLLLRRPELLHVDGRDELGEQERLLWRDLIESHLATLHEADA